MRRLLKVRDARVYLGGQVFSLFGDTALWLAMGIWVKTLTGSNAAAGLVFFFANAPVLLAPLTGLLVDRVRRRPLLIAVNAATGGAVLLLLLVHGRGQVWLVYLVMTWYGLAYSALAAAQSALLTTMLPAELLADANGALRTVQESLRLVGPLTGAGLFVLVGAHAVAILDAATFAVPVISLLALRVREPAPQPRRSHWRAELTAGLRYLARTPALRHLVIAAACAMTVFGFTETVIYAVAGTGLHKSPAFVGVLVAVQGIGAVAGGPTAAPLVRRIGEGRLVGLGMGLAGVAALLEMPPFLPSVLAGVILFGVSIPWLVVGFTTLVQRLTPPGLQGRVYAAADTLVTTPQTVSIAVGAGLISVTGYRPLLAALAVVVALAAAYLLTRPEQRQPKQRQPEQRQPRQSQPAAQAGGGVTSS
ncbi:MAG TPA: MFS transporter [Streptosporangiaceae bacterium]|nr:MFS transporter [Streptosporangiaceae bacterium]